MNIIDPDNPIPKYLQISAWIKDLIQSGRYEKGGTLPSEVELARICQVNRNTLRQAISELTAAGILRKEKGLGTFVCAETPLAIKHKLKSISSFSDDLRELGIKEKTRIIKKGAEEAKEQVARKLILGPSGRVVAIRRLRTGNKVPFIYEESYLPYPTFKEILEMDLTGLHVPDHLRALQCHPGQIGSDDPGGESERPYRFLSECSGKYGGLFHGKSDL